MGEQLTAGLQRWSIIVVGLRYATHLLLLLLRMLYVCCALVVLVRSPVSATLILLRPALTVFGSS